MTENMDFRAFCLALCDVAGCAPPEVAINESGASAIAFDVQGVNCMIGHDPARDADVACLMIQFGPLPAERKLDACKAILRANALMTGKIAPTFAIDPATDDVLLMCSYDMRSTSPISFYQAIVRLAGMAREWRQDHFLAPAGSARQTLPLQEAA